MKMHKLKNNYCEVVTNGPSLISFKINKNDINYEILGYDLENFVSSFIMAPWVNRIKEGIFNSKKGSTNLLNSHPLSSQFKHAIHGTVLFSNWELINKNKNSLEMKTNLSEPWPFKGNLKSKISIGEKYITQKLTIFNDDNEIMPFSMGWHPWFKRTLSSGEIEIKFDSQYKWEISDELPTSKKIKSSEIDKFKNGYSPAPETLDDCYRIKDGSNVLLKWPELTLNLKSSYECGHLVIYTPPEPNSDLLCVEPQSATINSFQLDEESVSDTGILFVEPKKDYSLSTKWSWE
ncbi:MAG: hypothetical protein ACJ0GV_00630 [Dehalococcoidia bacterium]|nr:hypothetical protein [Chloroflexota bacterium]|tara:strand:- start:364 stop:1236 length:873 start_codon:yes stop_codon:yes gene_type:complete